MSDTDQWIRLFIDKSPKDVINNDSKLSVIAFPAKMAKAGINIINLKPAPIIKVCSFQPFLLSEILIKYLIYRKKNIYTIHIYDW